MAGPAKPPVSALKSANSHRKHKSARLCPDDEPTPRSSSFANGFAVAGSPWSKKLILTLDGGGIRGYSSLIILRALMREIEKVEKDHEQPALSSAHTDRIPREEIPAHVYREGQYLPSHYFDYIAGTSFGGLIAIMLGMLGNSVEHCIKEFNEQKDAIPLTTIPHGIEYALLHRRTTWPLKRSSSFYDTFARFSIMSTSASAGSKAVPSSPASASSASSFKKDSFQCQTLAWCTEIENRKPHAFRSYEDFEEADRPVSIPEVAKAITTPPTASFKPFQLGKAHFVDGSKQIRDPTLEVLKEISALLESDEPAIDLLLSLGTDEHHSWIYEILRRPAPSTSQYGDANVDREKGRLYQDYQRFEVPDIKLGFRRKFYLREIEAATDAWLAEEGVPDRRKDVRRYAEELVSRRRARAATPDWDKFALGLRYICFHQDCPERDVAFDSRGKFLKHLMRRHGFENNAEGKEQAAIEAELDKGKVMGFGMDPAVK